MEVFVAQAQYAAGLKESMTSAENSGFMLFEPGERLLSEQGCRMFIEHVKKAEDSELFIAVEDEIVKGYMMVRRDSSARTRHRAFIAVGVHEDFRGQGVGRALFQNVHEWAKDNQISRLEMTVISHNVAAIHLYEKMGYEREGIKRNSLIINGQYTDEIYLSKLL